VAFNDPLRKRFINPKEMMDGVSSYLEDGFAASNIKVDGQSTKVLQLKMIDLKGTSDWRFKSFFKMELINRWSGFLGQGTGIYKWEVALG